jgi:FkbM family methyltransferase
MKERIKALLPNRIWRYARRIRERWFDVYARKSYSAEGEDLLMDRFLENKPLGFYVDVGAHHPKRFSNTYRLYCKGWRGVNIDANPGSMTLFQQVRPGDLNIEAAVSSAPQELTYYRFNEPALNTFSKSLAMERVSESCSIIEEITIQTEPLWQILDRHLPAGTSIDLMTVDVEGFDYEVLRSNDWSRYSPRFVLVECLGADTLDQANSDPVARLLLDHHYAIVAKTMSTVLFRLMQPGSGGSRQ